MLLSFKRSECSREPDAFVILSNTELCRALDDGRLVIAPQPSPRPGQVTGGKSPFNTSSVDLRLDVELVIPTSLPVVVDITQPGSIKEFLARSSKREQIARHRPYPLQPNEFLLGQTIERVELPIPAAGDTCLAARIEGRSSLARLGLLIHFTAPTIHPGFVGPITLEIINLGPNSLQLTPEMFIAQLIVEEVRGLPMVNPSQFHGQSQPTGQ